MNNMKSLAIVLAGSALAVGAQAGTVSFSFANPMQTTEISQTGNLGLFDNNLGVLTGVSLAFNGANTTMLTLTNKAAQAQTTKATSTTDLFFGSSLASLNTLIVASNPVVSLSVTTGFQTLASGASATFGPLTDSDSVVWTSQLNGILASFIGTGDFSISCTSLSGISIQGGGGNIGSDQATQAGCGADIVYTYSERQQVPEPDALALVGIALAGLALVRRRKA
jgi:hypothetical protein